MARHAKKGNPWRGVFWLVVIIVGAAILLGWNPLGLTSWDWHW